MKGVVPAHSNALEMENSCTLGHIARLLSHDLQLLEEGHPIGRAPSSQQRGGEARMETAG